MIEKLDIAAFAEENAPECVSATDGHEIVVTCRFCGVGNLVWRRCGTAAKRFYRLEESHYKLHDCRQRFDARDGV